MHVNCAPPDVLPGRSFHTARAAQIEALLKPNVFEHPRAMVFVSLVGAGSGGCWMGSASQLLQLLLCPWCTSFSAQEHASSSMRGAPSGFPCYVLAWSSSRLRCAGASADVEQAFQGKPHRSVQLSSSSEAASLLEVLGDLAAANPDVKPAHLDHTALQASAAVSSV